MMLAGGTPNDAAELLTKAVGMLGAKFDSIQIFVSSHNKGTNKTFHASAGHGNWYARYGQVTEWVNNNEQAAFEKAVREREDQDDEDEEDGDDSGTSSFFGAN